MIISVLMMYFLCAPMGYLTGLVYLSMENIRDADHLPLLCTILPPFAAILACICIFKSEKGD